MSISSPNRLLILGGSGLVGSALKLFYLNSHTFQVFAPSRLELDLYDQSSVLNYFTSVQPTHVVLAAAHVGGIAANLAAPADFILNNLLIQTNVIYAAHLSNVHRFIFLGSNCVYPVGVSSPIKESLLFSGSVEPTNDSFAIAKLSAIKLIYSLRVQHNFPALTLIPSCLYGPRDNFDPLTSHVLPALINRFHYAKVDKLDSVTCWGSGSPRRELLYIDDLIAAIDLFLRLPTSEFLAISPPHYSINIGFGSDHSIYDLAHLVASSVGFRGEITWDNSKPDGVYQKLLDSSYISSLGWSPSTSISDGIESAYDYFLQDNS